MPRSRCLSARAPASRASASSAVTRVSCGQRASNAVRPRRVSDATPALRAMADRDSAYVMTDVARSDACEEISETTSCPGSALSSLTNALESK